MVAGSGHPSDQSARRPPPRWLITEVADLQPRSPSPLVPAHPGGKERSATLRG